MYLESIKKKKKKEKEYFGMYGVIKKEVRLERLTISAGLYNLLQPLAGLCPDQCCLPQPEITTVAVCFVPFSSQHLLLIASLILLVCNRTISSGVAYNCSALV